LAGWIINPLWSNAGGTDIRNWQGWWKIQIIELPQAIPVEQKIGLPCPTIDKPSTGITIGVIPPSGRQEQSAQMINYGDAVRASGISTTTLYAVGHDEYNDIFSDIILHHVDWCIIIYPNNANGGQFSPFNVRTTSD
jgi:hypothetical protein